MGQRYLYARRSDTLVSIIVSHRCVNVLESGESQIPLPKLRLNLKKNIKILDKLKAIRRRSSQARRIPLFRSMKQGETLTHVYVTGGRRDGWAGY